MVRKCLRDFGKTIGAAPLDLLGDLEVQHRAGGVEQAAIDRIAHERVLEDVVAGLVFAMDKIERLHGALATRRYRCCAATTASKSGSKRRPTTAAACNRARSADARRSTRAVSSDCTLAGSAFATVVASKTKPPAWRRTKPCSRRKLTSSSANKALPSAFAATSRRNSSGSLSAPNRRLDDTRSFSNG